MLFGLSKHYSTFIVFIVCFHAYINFDVFLPYTYALDFGFCCISFQNWMTFDGKQFYHWHTFLHNSRQQKSHPWIFLWFRVHLGTIACEPKKNRFCTYVYYARYLSVIWLHYIIQVILKLWYSIIVIFIAELISENKIY